MLRPMAKTVREAVSGTYLSLPLPVQVSALALFALWIARLQRKCGLDRANARRLACRTLLSAQRLASSCTRSRGASSWRRCVLCPAGKSGLCLCVVPGNGTLPLAGPDASGLSV